MAGRIDPRAARWICVLLIGVLGAVLGLLAEVTVDDRTPMQEASKARTIQVFDDAGRRVRLPHPAWRIAVLSPAAEDVLIAMGLGPRIRARDILGSASSIKEPAVAPPPRITLSDPDWESLLKIPLDLLIVDGSALSLLSEYRLPFPVYVYAPGSYAEMEHAIRRLGKLTGEPIRAEEVLAGMRQEVARIKRAREPSVKDVERPRVLVELSREPLLVAGPEGLIADLVRLAGGQMALAGQGEILAPSEADLQAADPVLIVTVSPESQRELVAGEREGWDGLAAVREGHILLVDGVHLLRASPQSIEILQPISDALRETFRAK